jgi:hypothetical protein
MSLLTYLATVLYIHVTYSTFLYKVAFILILVYESVFERKLLRRILGPVYDNKKENWGILTNKEIYATVKKTHHNRDNKVT